VIEETGDGETGRSSVSSIERIKSRYLLVINIPLYTGASGLSYADQLWFKDLTEHLSYIENFTIACPRLKQDPPLHARSLEDDPRYSKVQFVNLPGTPSFVRALLSLPVTVWKLWRAILNADIVHSGVGGWPMPLGWIAIPLSVLLRKKTVTIVESAPWRLQPGLPAGFKSKLRATVYEHVARWCMSRTDLAIFTQEEYRQSLLPDNHHGRGHVIHASWIDEDVILSNQQFERAWQLKMPANSGGIKVLYAGRLDVDKGVLVLLEAINRVSQKNIPLELGILGAGVLTETCKTLSDSLNGSTCVRMLGTVQYGPPLFEVIRQFHLVVVPSISDEQPRIVYDAYSQGVPVLCTNTAGLRDCVFEGRTGRLVERNNAGVLSQAFEEEAAAPQRLRSMGLTALDVARTMTHQRMHRDRQRLLFDLLRDPIDEKR
jgi:glycosyltransferase involved in cell wall biosynthesis